MTNEGNSRYSGGELNGAAASAAAAALHDKRREGPLMWQASTLYVFSGVFMARDNSCSTRWCEEETLMGKCCVLGNILENKSMFLDSSNQLAALCADHS